MSVTTIEQLGPFLASELPPAVPVPGFLQRLRSEVTDRLAARRFERALRETVGSEHSDLIALSRHQ